jgi:CDP-diacylglycerol---serine O-phosphatidyltransferase
MKHLPNILTLGNLFCGCIAIVFILSSQPYLATLGDMPYWITGTEQAYWGGIFIVLAAVFDMLDGFVARSLKIFSPLGKDLDSLADLVSFGVAPSMILFKMLWASNIAQPNALDVSMWAMVPAFLIACFGALRLARFNIMNTSSTKFVGLPIPATGVLVASFPLINLYVPPVGNYLHNTWVLYAIIALLCWLMVSKLPFFKLMPAQWNLSSLWPRIILLIAALALFPFLSFATIPALFILYIILSLVYKNPDTKVGNTA